MICEVLQRVLPAGDIFTDVCREWDEEFAQYFNVPLRRIIPEQSYDIKKKVSVPGKIKAILKKIPGVVPFAIYVQKRRIPLLQQNIAEPLSVAFTIWPKTTEFMRGSNCIPIFLDVFSDANLAYLIHQTKTCKLFYVTARDIFNLIKAKDPSSAVRYMSQSIADKYHSENFTAYRNKYIDVLMPGRGNPVLHEYMLKYAAEHPSIKYVYKRGCWEHKYTDGSTSFSADTREEYIHLLSSAKVSIVGCSGIDNAREGANGICFVTPRFYESAILGCALIGRYPDNEEFTELNMRKYCPNITSYEHFCQELERALARTPEELYAQNRDFIINSLTSKRAEQIQRDLESLS